VRITSAVIVLGVLLHGCAAHSAASIQPVVKPAARLDLPDARETLRRDLLAFFTTAPAEQAHWGVNVYSLRTNELLYSLNPQQMLLPASTQKLLTAAVAAERLGWDHRFTTRVLATGPIGQDGTLDGDLVIVGSGDPTINPRHESRWNALDEWAQTLQSRGLKTISGHLVGDDNAFAEPGWGAGWAWDDLQYGFSAPVGALQYHENQIDVVIGPGMAPGVPAIIGTSPTGSGVFIVNQVKTADAGADATIDIARMPGTPFLEVRGQIPSGGKPITVTAAVDNPTRLYLNAFRDALGRHGIAVAGSTWDIDEMRDPPKMDGATELLVDRSATLAEIVDVMMKWSRNGYAETLLFAIAPPGEPATAEQGLDSLRQTLAAWGIARDLYRPRDGSGLSRYNYLTADALTLLLRHVRAYSPHAEVFRSTLPVAGVSGTMAGRMKGTPAEGRVFAKTGSMSNVRAVSGYLTTLDEEPLAFSILINGYLVASTDIDALVDKVLVRLVEFKR